MAARYSFPGGGVPRETFFQSVLRRFGLADLIPDTPTSAWKTTPTFDSPGEYLRFVRYIEAQVATGAAREVAVDPGYGPGSLYGGRWFTETASGQTWRLIEPDFPFRGVWERVARPPNLIAASRPISKPPPRLCVPVVSFKRRFQVWMYHVSHSQLLLRSESTREHPTRLEILFTHAININLATIIEDLELELADEETTRAIVSNMGGWHLNTEQVFLVRGRAFSGHVLADSVEWNEDEATYPDPSALMELPGISGIPVV